MKLNLTLTVGQRHGQINAKESLFGFLIELARGVVLQNNFEGTMAQS